MIFQRRDADYGYFWADFVNAFKPGKETSLALDERGTAFSKELLSTKPVSHDHGIEVTQLTIMFGFEISENPLLVTRKNTRQVYTAVYNDIVSGNRFFKFLVEGAPGIGKSRNLVLLLKLHLEGNMVAAFHSSLRDEVYVFVPPQSALNKADANDINRYRCFVCTPEDFYVYARSQRRDCNMTLLYDPASVAGEPPSLDFPVVIAASPNIKHFANFNANKEARLYKINVPTIEEVLEHFKIFRHDATKVSKPLASGYEGMTFDTGTAAGHIAVEDTTIPLGDEHLRIAYDEVCKISDCIVVDNC